jgi:F1F0 ATPase subunit 2
MIKDLMVAFIGGAGIGGIHFAGLWWTIRRIQTVRRPGLLALTSFLVRAGLTTSALYLILDECWERLLFSLLGFMLVRSLYVRRWCPAPPIFLIKNGVPT